MASLVACDGTAPEGPPEPKVQFEVCPSPSWVAVQNMDSEWHFLEVPSSTSGGTVRLSAAVTTMTTIAVGYSGSVQLYRLSSEELQQLRCEFSLITGGNPRTLSGSVLNIPGSAAFIANYLQPTAFRTGPGSFDLFVRDTIASLIGSYRLVGSSRPAGVLLMRRFRSTAKSALPVFDFSSPDVRVLDSAGLALSGATNPVFRSTLFQSGGSTHGIESGQGSTHYFALTGSAEPGELYRLQVSSAGKSVVWYYAGLSGSAALDLGPDLPAVSTTTLQASPCRRDRAELPVQSALASGARISFNVSLGSRSNYSLSVLTTAAFRSGSESWVAEVPDIPLPNGQCVLPAGGTRTISATAYGGTIRLALQAPPAAGDQLRSVMATRIAP